MAEGDDERENTTGGIGGGRAMAILSGGGSGGGRVLALLLGDLVVEEDAAGEKDTSVVLL